MSYEQVPNIITGKDLDYLSDMFNWNYEALKSNYNAVNEVQDQDIKKIIQSATSIFKDTMMNLLSLLANGGANE